jgi:copper chaperone NosL
MKPIGQLICMAAIVLGQASCSPKPEAIAFGKDQCHFCKMTIVDEKFGAELVTKKGKVYKFDDLKCLLDFYKSRSGSQDTYAHELVVDFANRGSLINAADALYLTSPEIRSPMNGQMAAFQSVSAFDDANKQWNGTHLSWAELADYYK